MEIQQIRDTVADALAPIRNSDEFIRQIRSGEQDDGPHIAVGIAMVAACEAQRIRESIAESADLIDDSDE